MSKISDGIKEQNDVIKKKFRAAGPVKLVFLAILLIGTVLSFVFYDYIFGTKNAWCSAPDLGNDFFNDCVKLIPRLVSCVQIIAIVLLIETVVVFVISKFFGKTQRSITVSGLVCNLIRWLTVIILIIAVLAVWGVDTTALITGAGVLTLVIGLGMQSLIADVVAGLFIVFENEFNVGDWITVDGFRGQVVSIGIRTTKLESVGNIKIINNNAIQGILNHTLKPSVAKTLIDIEYGADIPKVEEIIRANVGKLEVPGAVDEVSYDGVTALGASGVTLQFTVHCYEGDIYAVGRALNRAVKVMFDTNGINIPFNQIVVHTAE